MHTDSGLRASPELAARIAVEGLNTAQAQYHALFGRYAGSLTELGPPASGPDNAAAANLISRNGVRGEIGTYRLMLTKLPAGYSVEAVSAERGKSGRRSFYSDQTQVISESFGPKRATLNGAP